MDFISNLFGSRKPARVGRPANETDNYAKNREARLRMQAVAEVDRNKQAFHNLVGPVDHGESFDRSQPYDAHLLIEPLAVIPSEHSPNPSVASFTPSRTPEPPKAGPSGTTSPPQTQVPVAQSQSSAASRSVPVYSLSDVKASLRSVVGMIPTSSLQDEMKDLYGCCLVLINLLETNDTSIDSDPNFKDLHDMTHFLGEWTRKKSKVQQMQRNDIHNQVRAFEDIFTRHLTVFILHSQRKSATVINKGIDELQAKVDTIQSNVRSGGNSDPRNTEQADPNVLIEQVRRVTGHEPLLSWITRGQITRNTVALSLGNTFDVYRGNLDGDLVAIKLLRQTLKNDGEGVRFVERIMRQVQLWTSFSSPFILECRGIGMQMSRSDDDEEYDQFGFYLVSSYMRRGDAVRYIAKLRRQGTYVNILKYLRDAALGIQYLHRKNCVHASIRGENVLIKDDGTACLNGFGLTKAFTVGVLIELSGGDFKYHWMAPELLAQDKPPLNPPCDIWAWAMTALELISGKQPYYRITQFDLLDHVVNKGKRPELSDHPAFEQNCPQPALMWALLEKCWTSASERLTIDQVIEELEKIEKAQIEQQTTHIWT